MPLPAAFMVSIGAIGIGVLAFALLVFSRSQAIQNVPNRRFANDEMTNNGVRRRPIVCNDCSICQDEILRFQQVMQIHCGHRFHSYCLEEWLKLSKTCPTCRCEAVTN